MSTYIYIYIHIYIYTCMNIYIFIYIYINIQPSIHMITNICYKSQTYTYRNTYSI